MDGKDDWFGVPQNAIAERNSSGAAFPNGWPRWSPAALGVSRAQLAVGLLFHSELEPISGAGDTVDGSSNLFRRAPCGTALFQIK